MNDFEDFLWIVIVAIVAVHIVFGLISARVADGKGRDPLLGFALGLLLNIFGLIIAMMMRPSIEAEAQRRIQVEREYERQRRPAPVARTTNADGHRRVIVPNRRVIVPIRRARYGDVVDLRFVVLSTPDQRADGLSLLSEFITGVLYFWPEGGTHKVGFLNPYSSLDLRVAIVDTSGTIGEILLLAAGRDSTIEPISPVASAIAFRASRFESLGIGTGDEVVLPDELRT